MTEVLTAAQMRAIEQAAIESGHVTGLELMERAGQGVVDAIFEEWPEFKTGPTRNSAGERVRRAIILCGPGNNGGDGFVVARLLAEKDWDIEISLYGDPTWLPPDAKTNYERYLRMGRVFCRSDYDDPWVWFDDGWENFPNNVVIDALFGTGLSRPLPDDLAMLTGYIGDNRHGWCSRVVAVDIPSGLHTDSGDILGHGPEDEALIQLRDNGRTSFACFKAISADLTVTFHRAKKGHLTGQGPWMCGKLVVKDIGL
ncbi:MAG: NAD(P)H-hydrate epimerase [Pseudomonadota bacterium]